MNQVELYDDQLDFPENRDQGPFGAFANDERNEFSGPASYDFFGKKVFSPFGIAAGPLPTPAFIDGALRKGFDIVTLKSVRTAIHPLNPFPQVRPVVVEGDLPANSDSPVTIDSEYRERLAVANSFGIPSVEPSVWQAHMKESFALTPEGQALLVAFQGTARGEGRDAFVQDHVDGVRLIRETGADTIEINLSCPNEGEAVLACFDTEITEAIVQAVRKEFPDIKLLIKLAYFEDKDQLEDLMKRVGPLLDGVSAINTMGTQVVDEDGNEVFPGRPTAGVSGAPIKWAGLEMTKSLDTIRKDHDLNYKIIGMGGVLSAADFQEYRDAGADYVMSVAGAMWNPGLGQEIRNSLA